MHMSELSEHEVNLVMMYRQQVWDAKERAEKQKSCKHEWRFAASGHNDDAYECKLCGAMKWE